MTNFGLVEDKLDSPEIKKYSITQHAEWILNKIENTFNGTFTG